MKRINWRSEKTAFSGDSMYPQILSVVLFASKGGTKSKNMGREKGFKDHKDAAADEIDANDPFSFSFLDEYPSIMEETAIDEPGEVNGELAGPMDDSYDIMDDMILGEMKQLYSDLENLLTKSFDRSEIKDDLHLHEEGVIGLPVTPEKESEASPGVISLQVTPPKIHDDGVKKTIKLPAKPLPVTPDTNARNVIELPTRPLAEDAAPGVVIELSRPRDSGSEATEMQILSDIGKRISEEESISHSMSRRGLLQRPFKEKGGSPVAAIADNELKRLQELQRKQREAIKKRLQERKKGDVSWNELVEVKKKRLEGLNALKKKRKSRRSRFRKEKLHKLKEREEEKMKKLKENGIRDTRPAVFEKRETPEPGTLPEIPRTEREKPSKSIISEPSWKTMAVPPKEAIRSAPVVPGVTFAAIKRCPDCGGFINLSVSNKCYSCGRTIP